METAGASDQRKEETPGKDNEQRLFCSSTFLVKGKQQTLELYLEEARLKVVDRTNNEGEYLPFSLKKEGKSNHYSYFPQKP